MIYLIDDKVARQRDYGWSSERFNEFGDIITAINSLQSLEEKKSDFFSSDENIILFHVSFYNSSDNEVQQNIKALRSELKEHEGKTPIAYFSGSTISRYNNGKVCVLPPDILYNNLTIFIEKCRNSEFDFNYLLFGENSEIESRLKNDLKEANKNGEIISTEGSVLYAYTPKYACSCLFDNADRKSDWDFIQQDVPDEKLDKIVKEWFTDKEYDAIYIPLCFGQTLSDYMGLRMAMHIRLTDTLCKYKPLYIYGEVSIEDIQHNECFDILKSTGVSLIHCDYDSMKLSSQNREICTEEIFVHEIKNIHLPIPTNIGNNHSISNRWAIYRWKEMLNWKETEPDIINEDFNTNLYFKYLDARFGKHQRFSKPQKKYDSAIDGIDGKTIVYIDDEYDKGWSNIMKAIFDNSKANFICYKDFSKKYSKSQLTEKIKDFLKENEADCYLIDLRLHEDDFLEDENLTGHQIADFIKTNNKGNQIVVFTASNKIWNLKKQLMEIGAIGYALKESPESNYTRDESKQLLIEFYKAIKKACELSYLKDLYKMQEELVRIRPEAIELEDIIDLLSLDGGNENSIILKSVLLTEIVFLEHYIEHIDNLTLLATGEKDAETVELCHNSKNISKLTGHIFVKRDTITNDKDNVVDVYYSDQEIKVPDFLHNVKKTTATLIISSLLLYYGLHNDAVKQYINLKLIRNSQVAHSGDIIAGIDKKYDLRITIDKLVNFYKDVIAPVIKKSQIV